MVLTLADLRPPLPPADLMLRVAPSFDPEHIEGAGEAFDLGAIHHLHAFERALAATGRTFSDFTRLLDFGCGCGRFLRHFGSLAETTEIHGTDIDAEMIAWVQANIPFAHATVAPHLPPTGYPDHHFDLIINHSVFTHLDEVMQDLWLGELHRVSRPGAILLLTFEGPSSWNRTVALAESRGHDTSAWREELQSRGILFIRDDHFVGSTHPDFYHSTVHAPWYVLEHWGHFFDVLAYLPEGSDSQDMVVLHRRSDDAPSPSQIRHRGQTSAAASTTARRVRWQRDALSWARRRFRPGSATVADDRVRRELEMLRAGIYEQGNRISVISSDLRDEVNALRKRLGDD
jgi:SAM-dependent methyltransferase